MLYHGAYNFVLQLLALCTFVLVCTGAEETVIEVIPSLGRSSPELGKNGTQHKALANLKRDNVKPLFDIPSFRLAGLKDDLESLFVKTQSKYRLLKNNSTETIWRGKLQNDDGRIGFATVVSIQDSWAGTFVTDKASYELRQRLGGGFEVRWTLWKDFLPEDEDDVEEEEYFRKLNTNSTIAAGRQMATFIPRDHSNSWIMADGSLDSKSSVVDKQLRHGGRRTADITTMDVLIAVTNEAMCEYADLNEGCEVSFANTFSISQRLTVVEAETNEAFQNSGLNVEIRVVGTLFLEPGTFSYQPTSGDLREFARTDLAKQWQQNTGADLVSLITGSQGMSCGRAFVGGIYSAVFHGCFGQFSFTHELGHCIGCRHDRENCATEHPYAHGYKDGSGLFRTVMAYSCPGGCPRVLYFSSDDITYDGRATGDFIHDCARLIEEKAPVVAGRNSPPDSSEAPIISPSTPTSPTTPSSPPPLAPSPTLPPTTTAKTPVPPIPQPTRPKFTQSPTHNIPGPSLTRTPTALKNTPPPLNFGSITSRPSRAPTTSPPSTPTTPTNALPPSDFGSITARPSGIPTTLPASTPGLIMAPTPNTPSWTRPPFLFALTTSTPSTTSPSSSPAEEEKLTCAPEGTHDCAVAENPMHVTRMFFFCFDRCIPERRIRLSEFLGYECGSCVR